jgi:hypothetical protein
VRRKKGGLSTHQPIEGDELRALRAWLRLREMRADAWSPLCLLKIPSEPEFERLRELLSN